MRAARGEYEASIKTLNSALEIALARRERAAEAGAGAGADQLDAMDRALAEVRCYLGQVLTLVALQPPAAGTAASDRTQIQYLDQTVNHLRQAAASDGSNPATQFYLGLALRTRIERHAREQLEELERAWRQYLDADAPLGHRAEVQEFLERRSTGGGWSTASPETVVGSGSGRLTDPYDASPPRP